MTARKTATAGSLVGRHQPVYKAAICEEFLRLTTKEGFPVTAAAKAVGLSPSFFSGKDAMLRRYERDGLAGLERRPGSGSPAIDLSQRLEALGWFVPAASFFYYSAGCRRGSLIQAIRRAAALPSLPLGWTKATRAQFLEALGLASVPECPAKLRKELAKRESKRKAAVPDRIARQIVKSPSDMRAYEFAAPIGDMAKMPLEAVIKRLAQVDPAKTCRLTLVLL